MNIFRYPFIFLLFFLQGLIPASRGFAQGIAVNQSGAAADSSAMLDINSQQKGLLIPRLTTAERNGINLPARALMIFNTSASRFEVNLGTPVQPVWQPIVTLDVLSSQNITWNQGGNNIDTNTGIIGASNAQSLGLITNNIIRLYVDSTSGRVGINTQSPKASMHIATTDALLLPVGTTAQRPATPVPGMIRYNAETGKLEGYTTDGWKSLH
jgi:hypothetical protein